MRKLASQSVGPQCSTQMDLQVRIVLLTDLPQLLPERLLQHSPQQCHTILLAFAVPGANRATTKVQVLAPET